MSQTSHAAVTDLGDAPAALAYAVELIVAVEDELGDLWRETLVAGDPRTSDRLLKLSQALRTAALALGAEPVIGLRAVAPAAEDTDPTVVGLEILVARGPDEVVVRVQGRLTATTSPTLALTLATLLADGVSPVLLDLSAISGRDAVRLQLTDEAARLFRGRGGRLTVLDPGASAS